jgi:Fe2+ or Zn2+ uptake regulation protein
MSANYPASPPADDDRYRRVVVLLLLSVHPTTLAEAEIERELVEDESFAARDAVAQALRDLAAAGVVHRHDRFVALTRTAVVTAGLLEAW